MVRRMWFRVFVTHAFAQLTWVGLALGAAQTEESAVARNPFTSPADVAAGAKTFRSHWASCH